MYAGLGAIRLSPTRRPEALNETVLVDRCRRNDAEAFARLVDAYQNRIYGFVRRMVRDPEDAADISQEVFVRAFSNFSRFDGRSSLRTWLFRIAYNLCVDRARRNDRAPMEQRLDTALDDDEPMELPDSRWQPDEIVLSGEFRDVIEEAIGSMSEKLRTVLLLHDREDLPYDEIAATIGVPVGTVKSRLFLARAHLQKAVSPYLSATPEPSHD